MQKVKSFMLIVALLAGTILSTIVYAEETGIVHNQEVYTVVYGNPLELTATSSENMVTLFYKNKDQLDWTSISMKKSKTNNFTAELPKDALMPPGTDYYFQSTNYKTELYSILTEFDPISGNPYEFNTMAITGEVIGYDLQYHSGKLPNGKTVALTTQPPTGVGSYPTVTSKLSELRSASNPHKGIDLGVNQVKVYAMANGKISFVNNDPNADDAGIYIKIAHNADGTTPSTTTGDLYSHYYHLKNVENNPRTGAKWKAGDTVYKGDLIAYSGDTGTGTYHLDFGFDIYINGTRTPLPGKYFFNTTSWNNGMDLDFVQPPRTWYDSAYGTMLEVYVYPKGTTDNQIVTPVVVIGADGQNPYTITMFKDPSNPKRFYTYLVGSGYDNQYANLYIKVERTGIPGYVTRPLEKFDEAPSKFYNVYVKTGSIIPSGLEAAESISAIDSVELTGK